MIAAPKATSHGDGGAATAGAFAAFTGMSAANAGAAADTASAATNDNTTFFIEPAPLPVRSDLADTSPRPLRTDFNSGCDRPGRNRTRVASNYAFVVPQRQGEDFGSCCLFGRPGGLLTEIRRRVARGSQFGLSFGKSLSKRRMIHSRLV